MARYIRPILVLAFLPLYHLFAQDVLSPFAPTTMPVLAS